MVNANEIPEPDYRPFISSVFNFKYFITGFEMYSDFWANEDNSFRNHIR